ncbi:MAG: winged helix-turn-helix transcriptional regulator [Alphaproteobacteria bacterium]|nr:winged helix-turn-helix transcriptional regulator [Alphaproteobacteria bacterium]
MDIVFKALADETRRQMLDRLLEKPGQTLSDMVSNTGMRRQSASKHLKILEEAGLVVSRREGREKLHFLNPVPIQEISHRWVDKFSKVRAEAILNLKAALESDEQTGG